MRIPILPGVILILVNLLVDSYIYRSLLKRFGSGKATRVQLWSSIVLWIVLVVAICLPRRSGDNAMLLTDMWILFSYLSIYFAKYMLALMMVVGKIPHLWGGRSWKPCLYIGLTLGAIVLAAMWGGALINRFRIDVKEVTVEIAGLPKEFDGYKILQFSDFHTGTYGDSNTFINKVAERINALDADAVVFTGDIVNARSSEIDPHVSSLARIKARDGVYAIFGNHDYGDYADWPSEEVKAASRKHLRDAIGSMGWRLLLNETAMVRRGNDSIAIIGVENIGDRPFPIYGSFAAAYPTPGDAVTKILLTHNPAHWVDSIAENGDVNVPLTLSGHTHAMQVELFGWSPAVWRYPTWGGLYSDKDSKHNLYVNIGLGTVGFPSRIGATPELTVITLRSKK